MIKKSLKYLIKWFFMLFIISIIAFFIVRITPTTPTELLLEHLKLPLTPENIQIINKQFGLDKPLIIQYLKWISDFLKGDWGISYISRLPLKQEFLRTLPYSLIVGLGGILLSAILGFFLGFFAGLKKGGIADKLSLFFVLIGQSVPAFILCIIIIYIVGVKYQLLKLFTTDSNIAIVIAMILVALTNLGGLSRVVSGDLRENLNKTYMKVYETRGLNSNWLILKHSFIPLLYGLVSALISKFTWVIGGTTVVEFAFGIPGVSSFLVKSIADRDYLVLQGYIMIMAIWMFLVHLILNLILMYINRRKVYEE